MPDQPRVSHRVHPGVHLPEQPEQTPSTPSATTRPRGPGPHLARSGRIYLFQIRLPKALGGGRGSRPLRLSLGAIPHSRARALADTLASRARDLFDLWTTTTTTTMTNDDEDEGITQAEMSAQILGALRAVTATQKADVFDHPQTPFGKLAMLERESEKAKAGKEHNPILVENADDLRRRYLRQGDAALRAGVKARMPDPSVLEGSLEDWNLFPDLKPEPLKAVSAAEIDPADRSHAAASSTALTPSALASLGRSAIVDGKRVVAYDLDRRYVPRPHSDKCLFSEAAADKVQSLKDRHGGRNRDADTMHLHADLFIELIGDHPVDTYVGADFQAFVC